MASITVTDWPQNPTLGVQCVSSARWDLCGGIPVRVFPTATLSLLIGNQGDDGLE
ncbi:MAG: hypothetical protein LBS44_01335 [Deltaproteobacteria bacterium]|nr:hypothetical protein [Deltaproteobacteria bacterium]